MSEPSQKQLTGWSYHGAMAWDTEATKERLLEAAIEEFSARGFSGARIGEIERASGCNRERIYWYFGGNTQLFDAALTRQLVTALEDLPIKGSGADAVADFAGSYFDISVGSPCLARLTCWEGLERGEAVDAERRAVRAAHKVSEIRRALPGMGQAEAEDLLLTIITLCHSWVSSPNINRVITGTPDDHRRRAMIVRTATLLAAGTVCPSNAVARI
jgi:AcrR family transcriptional regulator